MDFERLSEFAVIAKNSGIKKAAEELGISSATLSARLIKFEEYIGAPLFERHSDSLVLTSAGEQLLPSALDILSKYRQLERELHHSLEHSYSRLRIAVCGSNLPLNLGPFLDRLNAANPSMRIEILDDSRFGITDGLQSGEVDIYFAPVMEDFAPNGLSKNIVSSSSQFLIMPKSHPLSERSMVSIRELDREQFLIYPKTAEPSIRDFQLRNLEDSGIRYTLYDCENSPLFYRLLVPVGKGLLLCPTPIMDLPPNTVSVPVTDLRHPATNCFFYNKTNPSADVLAFAKDFPNFAKEMGKHEHKQTL